MTPNIGYHTRLYSNNAVKVAGGSFGGQIDMDTVNRLTRLFTVVLKPGGSVVFVDKEGREVNLYLSVDASKTHVGEAALKEWRAAREKQWALEHRLKEEHQKEIGELMSDLSYEEIVKRLRGES